MTRYLIQVDDKYTTIKNFDLNYQTILKCTVLVINNQFWMRPWNNTYIRFVIKIFITQNIIETVDGIYVNTR